MKHMKKILMLAVAMTAMLTTSCVSKQKYAELQSNYDRLLTEKGELSNSLSDAKIKIAEYTS